jgi:hypothetical protein
MRQFRRHRRMQPAHIVGKVPDRRHAQGRVVGPERRAAAAALERPHGTVNRTTQGLWPHGSGVAILDIGVRAAASNILASALLGLPRHFGLEDVPDDLSHLRGEGQRGAGDAVEVGRLQKALDKAFAPLQQRLDDDIVVHGVPPGEKPTCLGFHQDTPWTTSLQFEGTPEWLVWHA